MELICGTHKNFDINAILFDIFIQETHKIKAEISIIDFLLRLDHPCRSCMFDSLCLPYLLVIKLPIIC